MGTEGANYRIGFSSFLLVLILIGNGLVISSYRFNSRVRTATYVLIISLAVSDGLIGGVTLPLWIYVATVKKWNINRALQVFYLSFDIFSALASTLHLTVISIERFVAISRPYLYHTLRPRVYTISIAAIWCISLLLSGIYALAKLYSKSGGINYLRIYTLSFIFVFFIAPLIIITIINIAIFFIVKKLTRGHPARHQSQRRVAQSRRALRKEYKTALTLVVVTGLFYAAWLPFFVVTLLSMFCRAKCLPYDTSQLLLLMELIKWLQYSQSAFNPFVYAFRDREMRVAFLRLFVWCGRRARVFPEGFKLNSTMNRTRNSSNPQAYSYPIPSEGVPAKTTNQVVMAELAQAKVFTIEILNENLNRDIDPGARIPDN